MKVLKKYIILLILLFLFFYLLINSQILTKSIDYSFYLFFNYLFINLFPFFIISDLLINYNFIYYLNIILKPINKILKLNNYESYVILLSLLTGQPSNAKYIKDLLDNNIINELEASNLLSFTMIPSSIFVISSIGLNYYNSKSIGIIILISIYLANITFRLLNKSKLNYNYKLSILNSKPFSSIIFNSINNSFKILLSIFGTIIICIIILNIINNIINNNYINILISSILEITISTKNISLLNINNLFKIMLTTFTLSFSGISIFLQTKSILYNYNIKYSKIIFNKLFISLISILYVILICTLK